MDSIALRPENRRRDGLDGSAVRALSDAELAGLRSEAFPEDLPEPPGIEPAGQPLRQIGGLLPVLGLMVSGLLGALLGR